MNDEERLEAAMAEVFGNAYLLEAISATDPSLEVYCKLRMSVPMFARFVKANSGVRQSLYRLHDGWLDSSLSFPYGIYNCKTYRHPVTLEIHRLSGPAVIYFSSDGHPVVQHHYKDDRFCGQLDYISRTS
jgi:hypothetical protein